MKKQLRDIKITTLILVMFIMSIVSLTFVGVMGYVKVTRINQNVESIYNENLNPIIYLGEIRRDVLLTRIQVIKGLFVAYENSQSVEVNKLKSSIESIEKNYEPLIDSDEERNSYDKFKETYTNYMNEWANAEASLTIGEQASDETKTNMTEQGNSMVNYLSELVSVNKQHATESLESSSSIYASSRNQVFMSIASSFIVLLAIGLLAYFIIKNSMKEFMVRLSAVSAGDLRTEDEIFNKNEFGTMKKELTKTIKNIATILQMIKEDSKTLNQHSEGLSAISEEMAASAQEIASSVQGVATGAYSQADDLSKMKDTAEFFGTEIEGIVHEIEDVDGNAKNIDNMANSSNKQLQEMVESINKINTSFEDVNGKIIGLGDNINKIHEITSLINSIADQTNLLALNAAIEAARAGEAGKGFAIVADEIRNLAEQSKKSSEGINVLLMGIFSETAQVVDTTKHVGSELNEQINVVEKSISSFKKIILAISDILPKIDTMNRSAANINNQKNSIISRTETASQSAQVISGSSEEIAAASEEMNASSEEVASTAQMLAEMTNSMVEEVNKFKL